MSDDELDDPDGTEEVDPLAEDAAFAAWPAEVRQAWSALALPSLHDLLAGQERLAAEIRRQNQELRKLASVPPVDPGAGLAAALTEARTLGERLARASTSGLIALAESSDRHAEALAEAVRGCLAQPAGRGWLGRPVPWPEAVRIALEAQVDGARLVCAKTRQALADAGLVRIAPKAGTAFDPDLHHCLETAAGEIGQVLRLVREGWRCGPAVLRPADVVVGSSNI